MEQLIDGSNRIKDNVTSMQGLPVQCHTGGLFMGCEDCLDQKNPEIFDYSSNVEIDVYY